ncbi:MAG: cation:proton antiporter [Dehalococcoidia bacterium]|nr:cation:proton antiporter [Dehalococcoidia bacterium]
MHDAALVIGLVGVLIFAAHLFEAIFRHTRIPDVLPLVVIGILLGPLLGIATPTSFGAVGPIFTVVTFVLILFEAGTGLSISSLRKTYKETLILTTVTFILNVALIGVAAHYLTGLGWVRSFILASVVGGISSAIIAPMLGQLNMQADGKAVLLLESSITDVFCVIAALSFIDISDLGDITQFDIGLAMGKMIASFLLAAMMGTVGAFGWSYIFNKVRGLQNSMFTTAAIVFVIFGLAEWLGYSGAIAALAFGITLGNISSLRLPKLYSGFNTDFSGLNISERAFFAELVFILKTFFFVYIGISLQLANWWLIVVGLILTVLIFIIRPPVVKFTVHKSTPVTDASMLAIVIPRGLAAAVLASIPFQQGMEGGDIIQNVAYAIILVSIIITSLLVLLVDKTRFSRFYAWFFSNLGKQSKAVD